MNAQNLDSKNSRKWYQKDYSKLEGIFDAAVEKIHRRKIVYYASDRLYSDASRKLMIQESYKSIAWATPLLLEDIHTEIKNLERDNKLIPISPIIANDEASLFSFLEIVSEPKDKDDISSEGALELYQKARDQLSLELEYQNQERLQSSKKDEVKIDKQQESLLEKSIEKQVSSQPFYEEASDTNLVDRSIEIESKFQASIDLIEKKDDHILKPINKEEVSQSSTLELQDIEEILNISDEELDDENYTYEEDPSDLNEEYIYSSILKDGWEESILNSKDDMVSLRTILADIQEDSTYSTEDLNLSLNSDNSFNTESSNSAILFEELVENLPSEKSKKSESENKSSLITVDKKALAEAKKDYRTSFISFLVSLLLLGFYTVLMIPTLQGFDYIALILAGVGIVLAFDLKPKLLSILTGGMLLILILCMCFFIYRTGETISFAHFIWFLLIPLIVSSSFAFFNSRKIYKKLLQNPPKIENANSLKKKSSILPKDSIIVETGKPTSVLVEELFKDNSQTPLEENLSNNSNQLLEKGETSELPLLSEIIEDDKKQEN